MSLDATRWAWSAPVESSAQRLVLLAYADRADENHESYPGLERVELDTCLNIKTVQTTVTRLIEIGLLFDTGKRKGPTGRVRVLRLVGVVGREERPKKVRYDASKQAESDTLNEPKNGAVKRPQKRNDTKNGMIPILEGNHPKNGVLNDPKNGVQNLSLNLPKNLSKNLLEKPAIFEKAKAPVNASTLGCERQTESVKTDDRICAFHGLELITFKKLLAVYPSATQQAVRSNAEHNGLDVLRYMQKFLEQAA